MKRIIRRALRSLGYELNRVSIEREVILPASPRRPIGHILMFLEDVRARGFEPRGLIDVGANQGGWTRMALSVFPAAEVIMIEPQQEMRPFLDKLCAERQGLEFIPAGAGSRSGELAQTIWDDLAGSSFLPEVSADGIRAGRQRITPMVTIDHLLEARPGFHPDLVKLDVQGYELEVLKGGESLFARSELMILETSLYRFLPNMPLAIDCLNFMAERGFELYDVTESLRRPLDGALGQIDLAFARAGGLLRRSSSWDVG